MSVRYNKSGMIDSYIGFCLKKLGEWVGAICQREGNWRRSRCGKGAGVVKLRVKDLLSFGADYTHIQIVMLRGQLDIPSKLSPLYYIQVNNFSRYYLKLIKSFLHDQCPNVIRFVILLDI